MANSDDRDAGMWDRQRRAGLNANAEIVSLPESGFPSLKYGRFQDRAGQVKSSKTGDMVVYSGVYYSHSWFGGLVDDTVEIAGRVYYVVSVSVRSRIDSQELLYARYFLAAGVLGQDQVEEEA